MFDIANPTGTVANINSTLTFNTGTHQFPVSFGEDSVGNLYVAYLVSGEVYRISTTRPAGDYDFDGDVDNSDYNIWRATVGLSSTTAPADGNGNGVVDAADYVVWRKNLGASVGAGAGSGTAEIPEPVSAIILFQAMTVAAMLILFRRRHV
jgi:hypothetical protein